MPKLHFRYISKNLNSMPIEFLSPLEKFDFNHWHYHVPVSDEIAAAMMDEKHLGVLICLNGNGPHHMALIKAKLC